MQPYETTFGGAVRQYDRAPQAPVGRRVQPPQVCPLCLGRVALDTYRPPTKALQRLMEVVSLHFRRGAPGHGVYDTRGSSRGGREPFMWP